jgi:hypothetical protein
VQERRVQINMKNRRALIKTVLVLLALTLVPVGAAHAQPLENVGAQLQLNAALTKRLSQEGVRLSALKPGQAKGRNLILPVAEASIEARYGSGYFSLGGGFKWRVGKKVATVRRLLLNIEKRSLNAVVNGTALKLAELPPQQLTLTNFDFTDAVSSMKLTARGAATLNRRLGLHGVFKAGRSLGTATATGRFQELQVTGGRLTLTVDDAFRKKLQSVEADLRSPTLSVALDGGRITSNLSGSVGAETGLSFFQHASSEFGEPFDRTIGFINTAVSLEAHTVSGAANVSFEPPRLPYTAPLATIPDSPIQFNSETGEAAATLPMALDGALASLLNETIGASRGKPALFAAGEPFGTVSFTAGTR